MGRANIPRCNVKTRAPARSPRILRQSLARPPPAPFCFLLPRLTTRPNSSRGAHPVRTVDLYFIFIACISINSHWMYQPIISKNHTTGVISRSYSFLSSCTTSRAEQPTGFGIPSLLEFVAMRSTEAQGYEIKSLDESISQLH